MKIKRFNESKKDKEVTLYRLVCVPEGKPLVVDTDNPGKYYFDSKDDVDPSVLKKKSGDFHLIKVNTPESNIDDDKSEELSALHKCKCVVLKSPSMVEIEKIEPYKKAA